MAALMDRARGMLGVARKRKLAPTPFEAVCPCGAVLEGMRQQDHQVLTCKKCGEPLFVLPIDPLPPVTPRDLKKKSKPGKTAKARLSQRAPAEPDGAFAAGAAKAAKSVVRFPIWAILSLLTLAGRLVPPRRWFTVPRMVIGGAVVLVTLTTYWHTRSRHLSYLREEMAPAGRRGLQALADADWETARERLAFAVNALDTLRADIPDAQRFRQGRAEIEVADRLLQDPLEPAVANAARNGSARDLADRYIVIDAEVERDPELGWVIGLDPIIGEKAARIDASGFDLLNGLPIEKKTRVAFAAKIESVTTGSDAEPAVVQLSPKSGVLITAAAVADKLGLSSDPEMAELLRRQRRWLFTDEEGASAPRPRDAKEGSVK